MTEKFQEICKILCDDIKQRYQCECTYAQFHQNKEKVSEGEQGAMFMIKHPVSSGEPIQTMMVRILNEDSNIVEMKIAVEVCYSEPTLNANQLESWSFHIADLLSDRLSEEATPFTIVLPNHQEKEGVSL